MLRVNFRVEFDRNGVVKYLGRNCSIPSVLCARCRFKARCDEAEHRLKGTGQDKPRNPLFCLQTGEPNETDQGRG